MLHFFYKWRYERNSRINAYKLPPIRRDGDEARANLGSYISSQSPIGRGFRHYDLPRRRRKWARIIVSICGVLLLLWITYESIIALAAMSE